MIHGKESKGYRYRNIKVVIQSEGGTQKRDTIGKKRKKGQDSQVKLPLQALAKTPADQSQGNQAQSIRT